MQEEDPHGQVKEAYVSGAFRSQPLAGTGVAFPKREDRDVCDGVETRLSPREGSSERLAEHTIGVARRRRLRLAKRYRRARADADCGATRQERAALQPISYDRALLADPCGDVDGP